MARPTAKMCNNHYCKNSVNVSSKPLVGIDRAFCHSCEVQYQQRKCMTRRDFERRGNLALILCRAKQLDW